jgi:tRNA(fMet)-specific endonuclease VapC
MLILDTDHLTAMITDRATSDLLMARLQASPDDMGTTIINVDEKLRGWQAKVAKARRDADIVRFYAKLQTSDEQLGQGLILPYDEPAARFCEDIRKLKLGIGAMDAKIAAIALSRDATVLTRNLRDFERVPGLRVENWIDA